LPAIRDDEKPFELRQGWEWVRLAETGYDWGQKTPQKEFTYIDVSAIDNEKGIINSPSIINACDAPSRARKIVKKGTVIYSTVRPYLLNISVVEENYQPEPIASTAFAILHPYTGISNTYLKTYLRSSVFVHYVDSVQTGIAYPAINDKQFFSGIIPIPPLAEQKRIVAKVDSLMALCDKLEMLQQQRQQLDSITQTAVLDALLTPNAPPSLTLPPQGVEGTRPHDLSVLLPSPLAGEGLGMGGSSLAWQRLNQHMTTLFHTPESVKALRDTILQLAVMGKLVPQNPNDEPAAVLLQHIAAEKDRLICEGKIKRQKPLPTIRDDEKPFELPNGWEWVHFGECWVSSFYGPRFGNDEYVNIGGYPTIRTTDMTIRGEIQLKHPPHVNFPKEKFELYSLKKGDLLITRSGSIGTMAVFDLDIDAIPSAYLIRVRLSVFISSYFAHKFLQSPYGQSLLGLNSTAVGVPNLNEIGRAHV
jgi:type I restriction enzyme S subunit